MARSQVPPLPIRDGLNPTRLHLPPGEEWGTVLDYLLHRFPADERRLREQIDSGEVVASSGVPITASTAYAPRDFVYFYRDVEREERVPFEVDVLYRDERILVVDKPHFLSTMPRGRFIVESALTRLRRDLGLPTLSPAHRLDRLTAGVLMFTVDPQVRGAYQTMFAAGLVGKEYLAVARYDPLLDLPITVRSRIVKHRGTPRAEEQAGPPNAETRIEVVATDGSFALYRLRPRTGKTHQLRLHLNSLGIPIVGDNFYPEITDDDPTDYRRPLQLLASSLEFDDPVSGEHVRFESRRSLRWPMTEGGAISEGR